MEEASSLIPFRPFFRLSSVYYRIVFSVLILSSSIGVEEYALLRFCFNSLLQESTFVLRQKVGEKHALMVA